MGAAKQRWTRSGVRLRQITTGTSGWNWVFVPGGPGLGSESLQGLVQAAGVAGSCWLLDLPGDGSNHDLPAVPDHPYEHWPEVLVEATQELGKLIMVGHSTGGMFLLSVPELEAQLSGMVLVSSAPHAGWRASFADYASTHPIPAVDQAAERYTRQPDNHTLRELTLAAAQWNFTPDGLPAGVAMLNDLPFNNGAVAWADAHFDDTYEARWAPRTIPTLIISGSQDRVVNQELWLDSPAFTRPNIVRCLIDNAGHFPWIENPEAIRTAFADLSHRMSELGEEGH